MEFTPQQAEAVCTHGCNLIVTAGAGSGKTRVLVERFVALLDAHPDWPLTSIVAITFTEKAAREMRDRVRAAIEERLVSAPEADRTRWFEHHAALSAARIGTIHGLCAQLLRANPAEARLDPAFEVLDETEAALTLDSAIERALARLVREGSLAAALLSAYDLDKVRDILRTYARPGTAESVAGALARGPDALWDCWQTAWQTARVDAIRHLRADQDWRAALGWIGAISPPPNDKLSPICEDVQANAHALLSGDDDACWDAAERLNGSIKVNAGSQANWGGADQLQACKDALKAVRAPLQEVVKNSGPAPGDLDKQALDWLMLWGEAIALAAEEYARLKAERTALDFADLEHRARALLRDDSVCASYHAEFHHILVDEFQDTNLAQREIISRLSAVDRPEGAGRLFVVGDPKQSIYAFRGADVSVFGDVRRELLDRGGRELPLATSFRAHERLVGAFNDLFGAILTVGDGPAARFEIGLGTPMTAHRASDLGAAPRQAQPVTVLALSRPDPALAPDFQSKEDLRRWEAWALAQKLRELVDTKAAVWARGPEGGGYRPAEFGDMAVLFRAMTSAPLVEDVFKAASIPYVTIAGRGYFDRQEVWDLLSLLQALHNPADDLALAAALRSPLFGLSDEALLALRLPPEGSRLPIPLWQALRGDDLANFPHNEISALDFARDVLGELRDRAGRVSNAELLARALALTGYLAALSGLPDGARRRGNVEKLLRLARASGRAGLGAFNAYTRDLTVREIREGEATVEAEHAVRLMSVHASKGLEFPVVALFDTTWSRPDSSPIFTLDPDVGPACALPRETPKDDKTPEPFVVRQAKALSARREQAEHRRLLYVAATRASDYLILSGTLERARDSCWLYHWLGALGVDPGTLVPSEKPLRIRREWGECVIEAPATPPRAADLLAPRLRGATGWDHPALRVGGPVPDLPAARPPLLSPVVTEPDAPARTLSATQIAKLGHAPFMDPPATGRRAFRHAVLHDAPDALRSLPSPRPDSRWQAIAVGQTVHRALRAWLMPDALDPALLDERLQTYAWEQGATDPGMAGAVAERARRLLERFAASDIRRKIERAPQIYRELPFVYRTAGDGGPRAVHGVIDVLYFDGKTWHVLDYKTALVSWAAAPENARRYFLQAGVYAGAVRAHTGQAPCTYLYYIHPARLITVRPDDWQPALERLDEDVRAALMMED